MRTFSRANGFVCNADRINRRLRSLPRWLFAVVGVLLLVYPSSVRADLHIRAGGNHLQLGVAAPDCFRLGMAVTGSAAQRRAIFLAPQRRTPAMRWTAARAGSSIGIKTSFGELMVNKTTGEASLLNASGKVLVKHIALVDNNGIKLTLGMKSDERLYGSGSDQSQLSLDPNTVNTYVGNGDAYMPFYWSTAGYAVLVVGSSDLQQPNRHASPGAGQIVWDHFPGNSVNVYLMPAKTMADALRAYTGLTGHPLVPPEWAFGYLQSRWGWKDAAYVRKTLAHFRRDKLPVDAFIFDFEWYTPTPDYTLPVNGLPTYHDFQFNPILWSNVQRQVRYFDKNKIHWMGIRKPRLGSSKNLAMARARGWMLVPGSTDPVNARDLNYALPAVRRWWFAHNAKFIRAGMVGWWNDEGEATYTLYYYWNLAEYAGLRELRPNMRQFSINRAFCPGVARLGAAVWTGDTPANYKTLRQQPSHILNYSLAGMPWGCCDIGGFSGNPSPTLMARFLQAGVFFPIMRSHSNLTNTPHFPWRFGPDAESAMRKALDLRYRLVPMLYSLAHRAYDTGMPIMRPMFMEFPDDSSLDDMTSQWMIGSGLMAAPILHHSSDRLVYLPAGGWYKFQTTTLYSGPTTRDVSPSLDQIPLYVRAGSIVPLGPVIQSTQDLPGGPLTVEVYPGGNARFALVEDDGTSYRYIRGIERTTTFTWNDKTHTLSWKRAGNYSGPNVFTHMNVVVYFSGGKQQKAAALGPTGQIAFTPSAQ